jgi:hypothetical protein
MAEERAARSRPIRIGFQSVEKVLVEPEDNDRFLITAREAARACKQAEDNKEWGENFSQFLVFLEKWAKSKKDKLDALFLDIGDGSLTVLACTPGENYDFGFDDELSELDLAIVDRFPWCIAEVMQVPTRLKESQISFEKAIQIYGDGTRTQTAGST